MKIKYLIMLPAISLAASTSSWGQNVADIPAAAKVNLEAEFTEIKTADELLDKLASIIEEEAKNAGEEVDGKALLDVLGLSDITSYAMSSEKDGTEWVNHMFMHNSGSDKGIFALLGKKNTELSAPTMCPVGSDLVIQSDIDLRTLEALIKKVMNVAAASDADKKKFEDSMKKEIPELKMNVSALLAKMNVRLNLAIDLDDKEALPTPFGPFDKPHIVARVDGLAWIWDIIGNDLIAESGLPFAKKEEGGVTTYSIPDEMAAQLMGYTPIIVVDENKNHVWIASSSQFLARSNSGKDSLANSIAFQGTMKGLPTKGNSMTYVSKGFADFLLKIHGIAEEAGIMGDLADNNEEMDKAIESLKKINQGYVSTLSREADGIRFSGRNTESFEELIADAQKMMKKLQ